ncbi:MAG: sensor domain-containing diguanylate cyclase [Syntrophorhabdus sp.]|nr:sensor domain-containing diguanylate cyclase [Syntrophorhabdus sp.]
MKDRTGNLLTDRSYRRLLDSLYEGVYLVDRDRTIVYWNDAAEQMTGYKRSEVVGKHCWDGLLMHVDNRGTSLCTDRCLLHEAMELKKSMEGKVFFHHRDGHEVPVTVRTTPILGDRGSVLGAAQIFSDNSSTEDLGRKIRELERMALLDPLTRLGNRRYGQMNLSGKLRELKRYGWPFGVLFIDIDKFKTVNDTYGHEAGDRVLRLVAATIRNGLRSSDVVVRWGGEEFVAIVASLDEEKLRHVGEKLRALVERSSISLEKETKSITISIGATLARKKDSAAAIIKRADALMYQSKKQGRNRLSI